MTTELTEAVSTPATTESPAADAGIEDLVSVAKETMAADAAEDAGAPAFPTTPQEDETPAVGETTGKVGGTGAVARAIRAAKDRQKLRAEEQSRVQQERQRIEQQNRVNAQREYQLEQTRIALEARQASINEALHDPAKLAELGGMTPQEHAARMMVAGSPEYQLQRKAEQKLAELEAGGFGRRWWSLA